MKEKISLQKSLISVAVCAAIIVAFCSCLQAQTDKDENQITSNTDIKVEDLPQQPEPLPQPEIIPSDVPEQIKYINPLTGLETEKDLTAKRPITVMINNLSESLPQIGLSRADIVYETLEEGGITRLLCVFNDYSDIAEIGSVRSARDYYIDIADSHDAVFVHAGGSTYAYSELAKRGTDNVDGIFCSQFYRSAERAETMSFEHTLMISGGGIDEAISQKGYRTSTDSACPLMFSQNYSKGTLAAKHISFPFSIGYNPKPYVSAFFDYNDTIGEYTKGQFGKAHIDGSDGSVLSFKNVITLCCPMNIIQGDELGCIAVHFTGMGSGTYCVDGTIREIVWKKPDRSSPYQLFETDGTTPLILAPGKSYIAIVPSGTAIQTNE